jgi:hypothetical protein
MLILSGNLARIITGQHLVEIVFVLDIVIESRDVISLHVATMSEVHITLQIARDAVRDLDRRTPPPAGGNSTPNSAHTSAIAVEVAKDWRGFDPDALSN